MSVVSKSPRWLKVQLVVEAVVKFYSEWGRWVGLSSGPSGGSGKLSVLVFGHQVYHLALMLALMLASRWAISWASMQLVCVLVVAMVG